MTLIILSSIVQVVIFLVCARRLSGLRGSRAAEEAARKDGWSLSKAWSFWGSAGMALALLLGLYLPYLITETISYPIVSAAASIVMAWYTATLLRFSRNELAHRSVVAYVSSTMLSKTWFMAFLFSILVLSPFGSGVIRHLFWGMAILLVGACVCILPLINARETAARHVAVLNLAILAFLFLPFSIFAIAKEAQPWGAEPQELAEWMSGQNPEIGDTVGWRRVADWTEWLQSTLQIEPDLSELENRFHAAMAIWIESGDRQDRINSYVLTSAERLGFFSDEEFDFLTTLYRTEQLFKKEEPIPYLEQLAAHIAALAGRGDLTVEQRFHLLNRLLANDEQSTHKGAARIKEIFLLCDLAARLEKPDLFVGAREEVFSALGAMWVRPERKWDGGPIRNLREAGGFGSGAEPPEVAPSISNTFLALRAMLRFGVPEEVDTGLLASYLQTHSRRLFPWAERSERKTRAAGALEGLNASGLLKKTSIVDRSPEGSLFFSIFLLVGLAVYATFRAPRPDV